MRVMPDLDIGLVTTCLCVRDVSDQSNNQSNLQSGIAGEPDVTHRTSWRESTGNCSGRPKAFGQHCAETEQGANATSEI